MTLKSITLSLALLLSITIGYSQKLTTKKIAGKYHITRVYDAEGDSYNEKIEKSKVTTALADLKKSNPKYTAKDSTDAVTGASLLYSLYSGAQFEFKESGEAVFTFAGEKPSIAKWEFDAKASSIKTTDENGKVESAAVFSKDRLVVIVFPESANSGFEMTKE